jgi:penicillin-binding protein 2
MSVIHTPRHATLDERQLLIPAALAVVMVFFLFRLWHIQVVQADRLEALGVSTTVDTVERLAPRGRILDRNGVVLAGVQQNAVVTAVYDVVKKDPETKKDPESVVTVARLLGVTPERLTQPLKSWDPYVPSVVHVGVPPEVASYIAEAGDRLPGFGIEFQPTRTYVEPFALSHVLGYVWKPSEKEEARLKEQGITPQTYVGRAGFEAQYERLLMGVPGKEHLAVDPRMRPLRTISTDRAVPGEELVMSLDIRLQRLAIEALAGRPGAVVASDPKTGEILCLVSSPSFDIHLYDNGISTADYRSLEQNPLLPMVNRAIAGTYEPGSTYKIVTTIAAQIGGVFDENRRVTCNMTYRLGNRAWKCLGRHGSVDFRAAMAASCNVYFYDLAMKAGQKNLQEAMLVMGLGQRQGIDLPGEVKGTAPTPEWLEKRKAKWLPFYTLNVGIGQGDLSLTPLQMLSVVSAVANNGTAYKPHLLKASRSADSTFRQVKPQSIIDLDFSAQFWNTMREGLFGVIDHGTAGVARIEGVNWGGKTGSAQNSHGPMAHGWFVGFAPIEDPRIAIAVVVENGGHGGVVAAPVAKQIVEKYLKGNMSLTPNVQSTVRPVGGEPGAGSRERVSGSGGQ